MSFTYCLTIYIAEKLNIYFVYSRLCISVTIEFSSSYSKLPVITVKNVKHTASGKVSKLDPVIMNSRYISSINIESTRM